MRNALPKRPSTRVAAVAANGTAWKTAQLALTSFAGLMLLLIMAGSAFAQSAVTTGSVNLRAGPGTQYGRIATLPAGATLDVASCSGGWCEVDAGGGLSGYVSDSYIAFYEQGAPPPPPPVIVTPPPVYVQPPYYDPPYYGPGYPRPPYYGPGYPRPPYYGPGYRPPPDYRPPRPRPPDYRPPGNRPPGWRPDRPDRPDTRPPRPDRPDARPPRPNPPDARPPRPQPDKPQGNYNIRRNPPKNSAECKANPERC